MVGVTRNCRRDVLQQGRAPDFKTYVEGEILPCSSELRDEPLVSAVKRN